MSLSSCELRFSYLNLFKGATVGISVVEVTAILSETAHSPSKHKDKHGFIISQCKHTEL